MRAVTQQPKTQNGAASSGVKSFGLEWLWQSLQDVRFPSVLECGHLLSKTLEVLVRRHAKIYVGELLAPLQKGDASLWDHSRKTPLFLTEPFLSQLPAIPAGSLSAIFSWQLFDLLPRDALAEVMLRLYLYLEPGGVLFCLLREPYLPKGAECQWWLESLTSVGREGEASKPFAYPAVTNREIERMIPKGSVKTFLTRSGWREVLIIR